MDAQGVPDALRGDMLTQFHAQHAQNQPSGPWSQQVALDPALQGGADALMKQFSAANANPLDTGAQARQHAEDAIYGRATSRLDPQWQQREHDFSAGLANQGIDPNSEAYAKALGNFGRGRNDAYQQAQYGAIEGGGQEAQRQQGMDIQSRMAPLAGMQGLQGLTGMPGFNPDQSLSAALAQYQGALQKYGIGQQGKNSTMGGLMGLGGSLGAASMLAPVAPAAAAASDERLKDDVIRHPVEMLPGVPVATFRYKWEPEGTVHVGVIAQDLGERYPDLVTVDENGYRMVPAYLLLR